MAKMARACGGQVRVQACVQTKNARGGPLVARCVRTEASENVKKSSKFGYSTRASKGIGYVKKSSKTHFRLHMRRTAKMVKTYMLACCWRRSKMTAVTTDKCGIRLLAKCWQNMLTKVVQSLLTNAIQSLLTKAYMRRCIYAKVTKACESQR